MLSVSVWYGKLQFLGPKMATFCHFHTLINHKKPYNAVILAKGISAATQRPKALDFENLVHDFSEGVRISVPCLSSFRFAPF